MNGVVVGSWWLTVSLCSLFGPSSVGCSTFSQYAVVLEISVAKIDPVAPLEKGEFAGRCTVKPGMHSARSGVSS
jgi:Zn-dependent alcohol dehydrogenase